ncbi:two-component system response regulator AtoC [Catalinimonas alkaloidigena]|uniref:sigma-54-dependent transcriptional regulator n=1 Tax=Catalinimonas alkaloidigena TaxID=1075417 RepID=UPI0024052821|nr:sigma-54 dependent transcriptional regulator [Catalinimonas alkaloidigena]MDF9799271.1 two-component system response regulator AtoC [Catalinimonas alkaloidigena]
MKKIIKAFCVEDDPFYGQMIKLTLEKNSNIEVSVFTSGEELISHLYQNPDLVTIDFNLPGLSGLEILKKVNDHNCDIAKIIISGQENVSVAVESYKNGADYYIVKNPDTFSELEQCISKIIRQIGIKTELNHLKDKIIDRHKYSSIIGESQAILKVIGLLQKVENNNIQVLITGESGTGKEVVANSIHYNSKRKRKPFIAFNVAAIPEDLIESELFGHEKGAFTGANSKRIGKFEEADGGTILLDEVGEMDINLQTKLLRVLQENTVCRIGSNKEIPIDTRVLAATNKNLAQRVKEGKFREDLYYRLQGFIINLPPLRERENDVILLANHFLNAFCIQNKLGTKTFSKEAIEAIISHSWPGNIRELKSFVERTALISENDKISCEDMLFSPSIV